MHHYVTLSTKGVALMHLLRFTLVRVGRGWFKGNAHESSAFTAFRAMTDVCTCTRVCLIVALVELSTPLPFFLARLHHKGPQFAYQGWIVSST